MGDLPRLNQWQGWLGRAFDPVRIGLAGKTVGSGSYVIVPSHPRSKVIASGLACLHCLCPFEPFWVATPARIRVGSLVEMSEDEIDQFTGELTGEKVKKVFPMTFAGLGCPDCQVLQAQVESKELARLASTPAKVKNMPIRVSTAYDSRGIRLPTSVSTRSKVTTQTMTISPSKRYAYIDVMDEVLDIVVKRQAIAKPLPSIDPEWQALQRWMAMARGAKR